MAATAVPTPMAAVMAVAVSWEDSLAPCGDAVELGDDDS